MTDNIAPRLETGQRGFAAGTRSRENTGRDRPALELTGFGQFDLDPQLDLGQDRIEARVA